MRPLPLQSVCVAVPVAALTHPTETAGGTPRSSAADATGVMLEKQGFCFSGVGGGREHHMTVVGITFSEP